MPAPFALLLGADSLRRPRTGIGRMTSEIAEAVRHRPEIASLRLLTTPRFYAITPRLHAIDDIGPVMPPPPGAPAGAARTPSRLVAKAKSLVLDGSGIMRLRRTVLGRITRPLARAAQGRILYHEPNMVPQPFPGPTVVTVNDLSWHHHPEYHPPDRIDWIARHLPHALRDATRFVAISRFTADALAREFAVDPARIDVVPLAAGPLFHPASAIGAAPILAAHALTDGHYILSVSTLEPRKNFDRLVAAHLALPANLRRANPLVIIGGSGWGNTLSNQAADRARQDGTLRLLGHIPDEHLASLYARAAAFAYVSLYEGFGLPVLEAMAAGVPVIASSTTATAETAGPAADLVDPLDPQAIAQALRRILEDPAHAERRRAQGLAHAARYTWANTADALIASWSRALQA